MKNSLKAANPDADTESCRREAIQYFRRQDAFAFEWPPDSQKSSRSNLSFPSMVNRGPKNLNIGVDADQREPNIVVLIFVSIFVSIFRLLWRFWRFWSRLGARSQRSLPEVQSTEATRLVISSDRRTISCPVDLSTIGLGTPRTIQLLLLFLQLHSIY